MNEDNTIFLQCLERAENGDADSMLRIADEYFHGHGVEKNFETALYFYERAAQSNNLGIKFSAATQVGLMYYNGIGTPVDYDKAFEWLWTRCGAFLLHRNAPALYTLAEMYFYGRGVEQNYSKALHFYSMAYGNGYNINAAYRIGEIYEYGYGVEIDNKCALEYYTNAANHGNEFAMCKLGLIYETGEIVEQDYQQAIHWYRLAADCGNTFAAAKLEEL